MFKFSNLFQSVAGKGSRSSLHSTDDSVDVSQSAVCPGDTQKSDGNSINKKKKSILKKSDLRDKRDSCTTSTTVGGGAGSFSSSIVKSYYGSDPESEPESF